VALRVVAPRMGEDVDRCTSTKINHLYL